ncbi:MAG: hypothetical protein V4710_00280 [Verrucomicrobiota bacterium]
MAHYNPLQPAGFIDHPGSPFEAAYLLLAGWIHYLTKVLPQVRFSGRVALEAGVVLGLSVGGLHFILSWWPRQKQGEKWRFGWTLKITTVALILFAASITATGIMHQAGWLAGTQKWTEDKSRAISTRELINIKQVGLAIKLFASDYNGKYPESLEELVPDYLPNNQHLFCHEIDGEPPEFLTYVPGFSDSSPPDKIMLISPRLYKGKRAVLLTNLSGSLMKEAEFRTTLQKQKSAENSSADAVD